MPQIESLGENARSIGVSGQPDNAGLFRQSWKRAMDQTLIAELDSRASGRGLESNSSRSSNDDSPGVGDFPVERPVSVFGDLGGGTLLTNKVHAHIPTTGVVTKAGFIGPYPERVMDGTAKATGLAPGAVPTQRIALKSSISAEASGLQGTDGRRSHGRIDYPVRHVSSSEMFEGGVEVRIRDAAVSAADAFQLVARIRQQLVEIGSDIKQFWVNGKRVVVDGRRPVKSWNRDY